MIQNSDSMDEYVKKQRQEMFQTKRGALNEMIDKDIASEKDPLRLRVLEEIKLMPSLSEDSYQEKLFVYNNGRFRTVEEIESYNKRIEDKRAREAYERNVEASRRYYQSGQYKEDCKKGKFQCWLPFLIDVGLIFIGLFDYYTWGDIVDLAIILSPVALIITLILLCRQAKYCEDLARERMVPYNDPDYQKARDTHKSARLGLLTAAIGAYHSTSSAMKSITNPDTWNSI